MMHFYQSKDLTHKYGTFNIRYDQMMWIWNMYRESLAYFERLNQQYRDYILNIQQINELYNESIKITERMKEVYNACIRNYAIDESAMVKPFLETIRGRKETIIWISNIILG